MSWEIAKQRIDSFEADPTSFKDYDIHFLSGVLEGLNERRRFMAKYRTVNRGNQTANGAPNYADYSIKYPLDLTNDILIPSMAGEQSGFAGQGAQAIASQGSGTLLSMRLVNMLRYHVVETSVGAYFGHLPFDDTRSIDCNFDARQRAPTYDCGDAYLKGHYPVSTTIRGAEWLQDLLAGNTPSGFNTAANKVDALADPALITNPYVVGHTTFYNYASDIQGNNGSGYPGNGHIGICEEIGLPALDKTKFAKGFQGQLMTPRSYSSWGTGQFPKPEFEDSWCQWTNKKELFPSEEQFSSENDSPYDFIIHGEYVARYFPNTTNPTGNSFMAISEMFLELIQAIRAMDRFLYGYNFPAAFNLDGYLSEGSQGVYSPACPYTATYLGGGQFSCTPTVKGVCGGEYCKSSVGSSCPAHVCSSDGCPGPGAMTSRDWGTAAPILSDCDYGRYSAYIDIRHHAADFMGGTPPGETCQRRNSSLSEGMRRYPESLCVDAPELVESAYLEDPSFNGVLTTPYTGNLYQITVDFTAESPSPVVNLDPANGQDTATYSNGITSNKFCLYSYPYYLPLVYSNCSTACLKNKPYMGSNNDAYVGEIWGRLSMLEPDSNTFKMISP